MIAQRRSLLTALFWMFTGTAVQTVVRVVVIAVLARLLTPAEFGLATAASVVIGFAALLTQLGAGAALIQLPSIDQRHVRTAATLSLGVGLAMAAVLFAAAPGIAALMRLPALEPLVRVVCLTAPVIALGVAPSGLLAREFSFRTINLINVAAYVFGYSAIAIAVAMLGLGVWALILGAMGLEVVKTLLLLIVRPRAGQIGWSAVAARELIFVGGGFALAKFGNYAATQGDNVVVARMLGASAVGLYARVYQLITMPATLIGQLLDDVLFSSFARIQRDDAETRRIFGQAVAFTAWAALPLSALMIVLAQEIVLTLLGGQWGAAVEPFRILSAAVFLRIGYKMSDALTRGRGAVYRRAVVQWIYAGTVIGGAFVGQQWGLGGVAWAVVAALAINYVMMSALSLRITGFGLGWFLALHGPGVALALLAAPLAWGLREVALSSGAPPFLRLLMVAAPVAAACGLAALAVPRLFLGTDNRAIIALLVARLSRRRRGG